jgi:hypothetical protein
MPKKKTIQLKKVKVVPDVELPLLGSEVLVELKNTNTKTKNVLEVVKKAFTR